MWTLFIHKPSTNQMITGNIPVSKNQIAAMMTDGIGFVGVCI